MRRLAPILAVVVCISACGECGEAPPETSKQSEGQTVSGGSTGGGGGGEPPQLGAGDRGKKKDEPFAPPKTESPTTAVGEAQKKVTAVNPAATTADPKQLMGVPSVSAADFDKQVLKSKLPVLVVFGTESCKACSQVEFQLSTLAQENATKVAFARVDLNAAGTMALLPAGLRRLPLPAFAFYQDGSPLNIRQGLPVASDASTHLKNWLKRVIDGRDVRL